MKDEKMRKDGRVPEEDEVRRWIRLGGRRPSVDPERVDRVQAKTRAHWRQSVRRRGSRRRLGWAVLATASLVAVLAFVWLLRSDDLVAPEGRVAARVTAASGQPRCGEDRTSARPLADGGTVEIGTLIWTDDASRVAIALDETGHSVRLDHRTRVRVVGAETLVLERGAVYIDSGVGRIDPIPVRVETPLGVVQDIGTRFEVRVVPREAMRVRVRGGAVVVRSDESSRRIDAATELWLPVDGSAELRPIAVHGEGWDWVTDFAPAPALDGLTGRQFLEWAAREGGWTLVWTDAAAETAADSVIRGGGLIESLSVEETMAAVLPTFGLDHRLENGRLEVSTDGSER